KPLLDDVPSVGIAGEMQPFLRQDGKVLYLSFLDQSLPNPSQDIYFSLAGAEDSAFGAPVRIDELSTSFSDEAPVVTPDDRTIYFASDRTDGGHTQGALDIWMATRSDAGDIFSGAVDVTEVNSASYEWPTFVTPDGCSLYLSSTR